MMYLTLITPDGNTIFLGTANSYNRMLDSKNQHMTVGWDSRHEFKATSAKMNGIDPEEWENVIHVSQSHTLVITKEKLL